MHLTDQIPRDWRNLQDLVGDIWRECGFSVAVEATVPTVRGQVEIDVLAHEEVNGRTYRYACECKLWRSAVPQTVVHAFRTVVSDLGINQGYLVSTAGFQSGAHQAAEHSNVKLLTWEEWQAEFVPTWVKEYLYQRVMEDLDPLLGYTEPLVPTWFCSVGDGDVEILRSLREKHLSLGMIAMLFTPYSAHVRSHGMPKLPLRDKLAKGPKDLVLPPDDVLDARGYRDFWNALSARGKDAIEEFEQVKRRNRL